MHWRWIVVAWVVVACGGDARESDMAARQSASSAGSAKPAGAGANRNACRLLTPEELKVLEPSVALGNVVAEEPEYSECVWED